MTGLGFYEWKKSASQKQPYYIYKGEQPMFFAALYDVYSGEDIPAVNGQSMP